VSAKSQLPDWVGNLLTIGIFLVGGLGIAAIVTRRFQREEAKALAYNAALSSASGSVLIGIGFIFLTELDEGRGAWAVFALAVGCLAFIYAVRLYRRARGIERRGLTPD
jgi:O-antigen/teichoic acid export membrane protein